MTTGEAIHAELAAATAVTDLVGAKIFPSVAPQGTLAPWLVYLVVSDVPENSLTTAPDTRITDVRLQVDCYAKKYLDAQAIADAADAVLAALSRADLSAWRTARRDLYDDVAQLHRCSMDFEVWR